MEFNEKLQELRKGRSLTQEELAEAIYVSRTAVSKWESGRGYPSIDSLKEISRFFSVSIDELICPDEIIAAAESDRKAVVGKYVSLVCGVLDVLLAVLLFIPVFGNGTGDPSSVSLFALTGISPWLRTVFAAFVSASVLNGICGVIATSFDAPTWSRRFLVAGMVLSVLGVAVFIATRQPYAGIICFALLVIKGFLLIRSQIP